MHEIFHPAGQQNIVKASRSVFSTTFTGHKALTYRRKRIYCALMRNDFDNAKTLYLGMSEAGKNEPMTKYLMFKVATRSGDENLASECLKSLGSPSLGGHEFLYACILDAQSVGSKSFAAEVMKTLVENYDTEDSAAVHLPALIRCTIRLRVMELNGETDRDSPDRDPVIDDICRMFDKGTRGWVEPHTQLTFM